MASADMAPPDRQQPPANLNLSSNNPFRNRLSMQPSSPRSMDQTMQQFPFPATSTNPFLDPQEAAVNRSNSHAQVEDIFRDMSVSENQKPAFSNGPLRPASPGKAPPSPGRAPPPRSGTLPQQRPLAPEERRDRPPRPYAPHNPDSPPKRPTDHRRRASETSMAEWDGARERRDRRIDRGERPPRTESEERRRRERRKEREERHRREGRELPPGGSSSRSRKTRNLDIIDKLDVTGVYGHGLFHHDGPFDACRPSRNAKKDQRAPMQAFPEGSANMALGGSGPNRSRLDLDKFHGRTEEGFNDFSRTRKADTTSRDQPEPQRPTRGEPVQYFNTTDRTEPVHGPESTGLGTSTFLEGAPASKSALQRRESEEKSATTDAYANGGGLQRKKSLAQRLRGMSNSRPRTGGAVESSRSPVERYNGGPVELTDGPMPPKIPSASAGPSRTVYTRENEVNLFDNEYDRAFEKKGAEIRFAQQEKPSDAGHVRVTSSPGSNGSNGLYRSVTADAAMPSPTEEKSSGGGFLSRMKSLKGGPRKRPERKDSSS